MGQGAGWKSAPPELTACPTGYVRAQMSLEKEGNDGGVVVLVGTAGTVTAPWSRIVI